MSSRDLQDVILVLTWEPPTPQTLQNPCVFIGFYEVSQIPSWTTLGEFRMPKALQNQPKNLQGAPKELSRTSKVNPSGLQKHQTGPQGPPRTSKVTHQASIVCKTYSKGRPKYQKWSLKVSEIQVLCTKWSPRSEFGMVNMPNSSN